LLRETIVLVFAFRRTTKVDCLVTAGDCSEPLSQTEFGKVNVKSAFSFPNHQVIR
jgi:hypothetical protein